MKEQVKKHIGGATALALLGITLPTSSRANAAIHGTGAFEQGELVHGLLFLGILITLVGVSRLLKKS